MATAAYTSHPSQQHYHHMTAHGSASPARSMSSSIYTSQCNHSGGLSFISSRPPDKEGSSLHTATSTGSLSSTPADSPDSQPFVPSYSQSPHDTTLATTGKSSGGSPLSPSGLMSVPPGLFLDGHRKESHGLQSQQMQQQEESKPSQYSPELSMSSMPFYDAQLFRPAAPQYPQSAYPAAVESGPSQQALEHGPDGSEQETESHAILSIPYVGSQNGFLPQASLQTPYTAQSRQQSHHQAPIPGSSVTFSQQERQKFSNTSAYNQANYPQEAEPFVSPDYSTTFHPNGAPSTMDPNSTPSSHYPSAYSRTQSGPLYQQPQTHDSMAGTSSSYRPTSQYPDMSIQPNVTYQGPNHNSPSDMALPDLSGLDLTRAQPGRSLASVRDHSGYHSTSDQNLAASFTSTSSMESLPGRGFSGNSSSIGPAAGSRGASPQVPPSNQSSPFLTSGVNPNLYGSTAAGYARDGMEARERSNSGSYLGSSYSPSLPSRETSYNTTTTNNNFATSPNQAYLQQFFAQQPSNLHPYQAQDTSGYSYHRDDLKASRASSDGATPSFQNANYDPRFQSPGGHHPTSNTSYQSGSTPGASPSNHNHTSHSTASSLLPATQAHAMVQWITHFLKTKGGIITAANLGSSLARLHPDFYGLLKASHGGLTSFLADYPDRFSFANDPPFNHVYLTDDFQGSLPAVTLQAAVAAAAARAGDTAPSFCPIPAPSPLKPQASTGTLPLPRSLPRTGYGSNPSLSSLTGCTPGHLTRSVSGGPTSTYSSASNLSLHVPPFNHNLRSAATTNLNSTTNNALIHTNNNGNGPASYTASMTGDASAMMAAGGAAAQMSGKVPLSSSSATHGLGGGLGAHQSPSMARVAISGRSTQDWPVDQQLEGDVVKATSEILCNAASYALKAVELANTLRARLGTKILAKVREKYGGLLFMLERHPGLFRVDRIPKNDCVTLLHKGLLLATAPACPSSLSSSDGGNAAGGLLGVSLPMPSRLALGRENSLSSSRVAEEREKELLMRRTMVMNGAPGTQGQYGMSPPSLHDASPDYLTDNLRNPPQPTSTPRYPTHHHGNYNRHHHQQMRSVESPRDNIPALPTPRRQTSYTGPPNHAHHYHGQANQVDPGLTHKLSIATAAAAAAYHGSSHSPQSALAVDMDPPLHLKRGHSWPHPSAIPGYHSPNDHTLPSSPNFPSPEAPSLSPQHISQAPIGSPPPSSPHLSPSASVAHFPGHKPDSSIIAPPGFQRSCSTSQISSPTYPGLAGLGSWAAAAAAAAAAAGGSLTTEGLPAPIQAVVRGDQSGTESEGGTESRIDFPGEEEEEDDEENDSDEDEDEDEDEEEEVRSTLVPGSVSPLSSTPGLAPSRSNSSGNIWAMDLAASATGSTSSTTNHLQEGHHPIGLPLSSSPPSNTPTTLNTLPFHNSHNHSTTTPSLLSTSSPPFLAAGLSTAAASGKSNPTPLPHGRIPSWAEVEAAAAARKQARQVATAAAMASEQASAEAAANNKDETRDSLQVGSLGSTTTTSSNASGSQIGRPVALAAAEVGATRSAVLNSGTGTGLGALFGAGTGTTTAAVAAAAGSTSIPAGAVGGASKGSTGGGVQGVNVMLGGLGPGVSTCPVLQILINNHFVPTQAWPVEPLRDHTYVNLIVEELRNVGGTTTVSKLRGLLKHKLGSKETIKSVPLKALLQAYNTVFTLHRNHVSLMSNMRSQGSSLTGL